MATDEGVTCSRCNQWYPQGTIHTCFQASPPSEEVVALHAIACAIRDLTVVIGAAPHIVAPRGAIPEGEPIESELTVGRFEIADE